MVTFTRGTATLPTSSDAATPARHSARLPEEGAEEPRQRIDRDQPATLLEEHRGREQTQVAVDRRQALAVVEAHFVPLVGEGNGPGRGVARDRDAEARDHLIQGQELHVSPHHRKELPALPLGEEHDGRGHGRGLNGGRSGDEGQEHGANPPRGPISSLCPRVAQPLAW